MVVGWFSGNGFVGVWFFMIWVLLGLFYLWRWWLGGGGFGYNGLRLLPVQSFGPVQVLFLVHF